MQGGRNNSVSPSFYGHDMPERFEIGKLFIIGQEKNYVGYGKNEACLRLGQCVRETENSGGASRILSLRQTMKLFAI